MKLYFFLFNNNVCPECRTSISRHPIHLDFSNLVEQIANLQVQAAMNNNNNNNAGGDFEYDFEAFEEVRYEMPTQRQVRFVAQFRQGILNIRIGRQVIVRTEGNQHIRGCRGIIWFSGRNRN